MNQATLPLLRCTALVAMLGWSPACGGTPPPRFELATAVAAGRYGVGTDGPDALAFTTPPHLGPVEVGGELRPAVSTGVGTWRWRGEIPPHGRLRLGLAVRPEQGRKLEAVRVVVTLRRGDDSEVLEVAHLPPAADGWRDLDLDLSAHAGRRVSLQLTVEARGGSVGPRAPLVAWAPLVVEGRPVPLRERPNILLVVVDTLRRDCLTPYGYPRDTTPEIDRLIARRGATLTAAYAQAAWTLPSMVSMMTSRYPGELLAGGWLEGWSSAEDGVWGIPAEVEPLAERLTQQGYRTAAYIAHPGLRRENGFSRGFATFFSPPGARLLPAPDLARRAQGWLQSHLGGSPWFLYAHFADPHEPYQNPDLDGGRSPHDSGYRGSLLGHQPSDLMRGEVEMEDTAADVAYLGALYDSEVSYVDRQVGRLLEAIPPEVMADTLVVFTADHGEELYDHGSWTHGRTLYDELIRVPLLFRWDRRIPAGRRLDGVVRLLDLLPTLAAAAGTPPSLDWQGVDLLPALAGDKPLPRLIAYSQHMGRGPVRAAVVDDRHKLVLFNRHPRAVVAETDWEHRLMALDQRLLRRLELYDLVGDPGERTSLTDGEISSGDLGRRLRAIIHRHLDRQLAGLRVIVTGLDPGSRLSGRLRLDHPPQAVESYFLAAADVTEVVGDEVRFRLSGERLEKGLVVKGDFQRLVTIEVEVDGRPLEGIFAAGRPWTGEELSLSDLEDGWPRGGPAEPALQLWYRSLPEVSPSLAEAGTKLRDLLEALGYAG